MWTHPFPLPQTTPQHHWTHKESFAREVGFEARGGAGLKASALFWVSEPVRRSIKSGVGKSNTEKFSLGGNRGSPSVRIFRRCGAQRVEWRHFSKQDEMAAAKEERQRPESILKKKKKKSKLRHNLIKILRWLKHSLSFHPSKDKTGWVPKVYLRSGRKGGHSVPIPLYLYGRQLSICSLIKAMWHLRHRVKQMAVFCWTGL